MFVYYCQSFGVDQTQTSKLRIIKLPYHEVRVTKSCNFENFFLCSTWLDYILFASFSWQTKFGCVLIFLQRIILVKGRQMARQSLKSFRYSLILSPLQSLLQSWSKSSYINLVVFTGAKKNNDWYKGSFYSTNSRYEKGLNSLLPTWNLMPLDLKIHLGVVFDLVLGFWKDFEIHCTLPCYCDNSANMLFCFLFCFIFSFDRAFRLFKVLTALLKHWYPYVSILWFPLQPLLFFVEWSPVRIVFFIWITEYSHHNWESCFILQSLPSLIIKQWFKSIKLFVYCRGQARLHRGQYCDLSGCFLPLWSQDGRGLRRATSSPWTAYLTCLVYWIQLSFSLIIPIQLLARFKKR